MTDAAQYCRACHSTRGEPTHSGAGAWYWWRLMNGERYGPFCSGKCMMSHLSVHATGLEQTRAEWLDLIALRKRYERGEE